MEHKKGVNWSNRAGLAGVCVWGADEAGEVKSWCSSWWCTAALWLQWFHRSLGEQKLLPLPLALSEKGGETQSEEKFLSFSRGELLFSIPRKARSCFGAELTYVLSNRAILCWHVKRSAGGAGPPSLQTPKPTARKLAHQSDRQFFCVAVKSHLGPCKERCFVSLSQHSRMMRWRGKIISWKRSWGENLELISSGWQGYNYEQLLTWHFFTLVSL